MEIAMAKRSRTAVHSFAIQHRSATDGLLVVGTWSVILVTLTVFMIWLVL
jgi:hypothetical protein